MAKNLEQKLKRKFKAIHDRKVAEIEEWEFGKEMAYLNSIKPKAVSAGNGIELGGSRRSGKTEEFKELMKASGGKPVIVAGGRTYGPSPEEKKLMEDAIVEDWKKRGKNVVLAQKINEEKEQ